MNPWNITEVANSIAQALNMDSEEREKRHKHNFLHVTAHTAQEWAETFVRYACLSVMRLILEAQNYFFAMSDDGKPK